MWAISPAQEHEDYENKQVAAKHVEFIVFMHAHMQNFDELYILHAERPKKK